MRFKYNYRIKWQEVDPMYFVRTEEYLDYYREASSELMRSVGYPYKRLEDEKLQFPIIDVHAKYMKPLRYDDEITIEVWFSKLKSFQIVVQYRIFKKSGEESANAKIIYGVLTKGSEELSPMPDELKEKLEIFVEKES
jgi:acyl-CoA thioester hydrolase